VNSLPPNPKPVLKGLSKILKDLIVAPKASIPAMKSHFINLLERLRLASCFVGIAFFHTHNLAAATPESVTSTDPEGNVTLVVPDDPFESWRLSQFNTQNLSDYSISGPLADPDRDGVMNLAEYVNGSNPWLSDPAWLPQFEVDADGTVSFFHFKSKDSGDVDSVSEFSKNLTHWHPTYELSWPTEILEVENSLAVTITSPFSSVELPSQFMRLHAVRPSLAEFVRVLSDLGATPGQLLAECVISSSPASPLQSSVTRIARRDGSPTYTINYHVANIGLYPFVETHKEQVKAYLSHYLARLESNLTIRDAVISSNLQTVSNSAVAPSSDDAYAGTFLRLASRFAEIYPDDPWFSANATTLKAVANANIVTQIKTNHLVKVFQNGQSADNTINATGFLMNNVEAWAGLDALIQALMSINDPAVNAFQTARDRIQQGIHAELWDGTANAWKSSDAGSSASSQFYDPGLRCQYYPELYGLHHPAGDEETQRRYDLAWQWLETHKPNWWRASSWPGDPAGVSDLGLAVVATKRARLENARSYMALAVKNWLPHSSRTVNASGGTPIHQVGYWQELLRGTPARQTKVKPFVFVDQQVGAGNGVVRSNAVTVDGASGAMTAVVPPGAVLFVNGVARPGSSSSVMAGDVIWLETTAPTTAGETKLLNLKIGGHSARWSVTAATIAAIPEQPGTASGYTAVEAGVSESGASQISIPITIPSGTRGMQPDLKITYSSSAGTGPLGLGFQLSGINVITRVPATLAQDGRRGAISFNSGDRYALDGQRLIVASGTDGADSAEYRLEFDPSYRIRSFGIEEGSVQQWIVENKAGLTMRFGGPLADGINARIRPENCTATLSWAIKEIEDSTGNKIQFFYDLAASSRGEILVTRIAYTSNPSQGLSAKQEILFEYEDRPESLPPPIWSYVTSPPIAMGMYDEGGYYFYGKQRYNRPPPYTYQFYLRNAGDVTLPPSGTDTYTPHSRLSATAVHAGILPKGGEGIVTVEYLPWNGVFPGQLVNFPGSTQNGITSYSQNYLPETGYRFSTTAPHPVPRPPTTYVGGYGIKGLKRLLAIEVRSTSITGVPSRSRRYDFTYQQDVLTKDSLLSSIQETLVNGESISPALFDWPVAEKLLINLLSSVGTGVTSHTKIRSDFLFSDFDGNGKTDVLIWNATGQTNSFSLALSTGSSFGPTSATNIVGDAASKTNQVVIGDFNGDSKSDVLVWSSTAAQYRIHHSTGNDFSLPINTNIALGDTNHPLCAADFNGDGRTDILTWNFPGNPGRYSLLHSEGASFAAPIATAITTNTGLPNLMFTGEFNGDGMTDIMLWNPTSSRYDLHLATGTGFASATPTGVTTSFFPNGGESNLTGDFNGDGLTDIMVVGLAPAADTYTFFYCKGGTFTTGIASGIKSREVFNDDFNNSNMDFNGDGKSDILHIFGASSDALYIPYLGVGDRFSTIGYLDIRTRDYRHSVADINGDGKTDFLIWGTPNANQYNLKLNEGPPQRLVKQVTNGQGVTTKFQYKSLTDLSLHTPATGLTYPNVSVVAPLYLVASKTTSNGMDVDAYTGASTGAPAENTQQFTYAGAWGVVNGRGFQGFTGRTVVDQATGRVSSSSYPLDPLLSGRPTASEDRLISPPAGGSAVLGSSDTTWVANTTTWPNGNKTFFVHNASSTSRTYEPNRPASTSLVKSTTVTSFCDAFGNITSSQSNHGGGFTEATTSTFDNRTGSKWLIGLPTTASTTKAVPGMPAITRTASFVHHPVTGLRTQETIEPDGGVLRLDASYTYDGFGNILSSTQATPGQQSRTTSTTYSTDGRFPLTTTNALGHVQSRTFDALTGNVLTKTDANGLVTRYEYDALGRQVREIRPDNTETRTFYRLVIGSTTGAPPRAVHYTVTQSSGSAPSTVWYDRLDREIRSDSTALDGRTISNHKVYSAAGTMLAMSAPYFAGDSPLYTNKEYDAALRPTKETSPFTQTESKVMTTVYDGLTTTSLNPLYRSSTSVANPLGWTVQNTDHVGKTITKSYDAWGNLRFVTDPQNNVTEIRYDRRGNKVWMSEPNSGISTFTYNGFGEVVTQTDAKSQTVSHLYDKLGRKTQRTEPGGTLVFTYDTAAKGVGKPASESGPGFTRTYGYDPLGRPASSIETHGSSSFVVSNGYDQYGRLDSTTYPTGFAVKRVYNSQGHLVSVKNAGTGASYWSASSSDARGQITSETLGNRGIVTHSYSPYTGLIDSISDQNGVQFEDYVFDKVGNLTRRRDRRLGAIFTESFTYDTLNRLKTAENNGSSGPQIAYYDDIGNMIGHSSVGNLNYQRSNGAGPHAITSVTGDFYTKQYAYDLNGNRTSDGTNTILYTSFNKPAVIAGADSTLSFSYAPDRSLFRQIINRASGSIGGAPTLTRDYVANLYERETGSDGTIRHIHYIPGGKGTVAIHTETTGTASPTKLTRYLYRDHLASIAAVTDSNGAVIERFSFDPWGRRRTLTYSGGSWTASNNIASTSKETSRGFTGHEMLDSVGLVHMKGRVYDPLVGRMLSPDPFVQGADNLQSFNRYSYVSNNSLSFTDPSGFLSMAGSSIYIPQVSSQNYSRNFNGNSNFNYNIFGNGSGGVREQIGNGIGFQNTLAGPAASRYSGAYSESQLLNNSGFGSSYGGMRVPGAGIGDSAFSVLSGGNGGQRVSERGYGARSSVSNRDIAKQGLDVSGLFVGHLERIVSSDLSALRGDLGNRNTYPEHQVRLAESIQSQTQQRSSIMKFGLGLDALSFGLSFYDFGRQPGLDTGIDLAVDAAGCAPNPAVQLGAFSFGQGKQMGAQLMLDTPFGAAVVGGYGWISGWDHDIINATIGSLTEDGYFR
jgi:RHS repeat-associated protein